MGVALVQPTAEDSETGQPEAGMALCLSGGGYRAMVFHVGALWRLHEAGLLTGIKRISSVSGGSITAGVLGLNWTKVMAPGATMQTGFVPQLVDPIRALAGTTIDAESILSGLISGRASDQVASAYDAHLFHGATLQALPDAPRFVINATNVQSGVLWRFSKPYMWDYRVGKVPNPTVPLAQAVAASSAFPPLLSPFQLELKPADFEANSGDDLQHPPFTEHAVLTDGGVYDNLGLETAWKRYQTILVSDAGAKMAAEEAPKTDWARHAYRVLDIVDNQVRSLRKRQLIDSYNSGERKGGYWGIRTDIADYKLADALPCPVDKTLQLAGVATRLKALDDTTQEQLINWGYAVCDAALRTHVDPAIAKPAGFPYPNSGV